MALLLASFFVSIASIGAQTAPFAIELVTRATGAANAVAESNDDSQVPTLEQLKSLLEIHLTGARVTRGGITRLRDAKLRRRVIVDDQ